MDRLLKVGDIFILPKKGTIFSDIERKYVLKHFHEEHKMGDKKTFQEVEISKDYYSFKKDGKKNNKDKFKKDKLKGNYIVTDVSTSLLHPEGEELPEGEVNLTIYYFTAKHLETGNIISFYQQDNLPEPIKAILLPEDIKLV